MAHAFIKTSFSNTAQVTISHSEIKEWVEKRGGRPGSLKGTGKGGDAGVLRIIFRHPDTKEDVEPITWNEFFDRFERSKLAFIYQDIGESNSTGESYQFVDRETIKKEVA